MNLLRHLGGYGAVKLASAFASFGGIIIFTRLLSAEAYGRYALVFSAMALIHLVSLTWVEAASFRFGVSAKSSDDLNGHFRTALAALAVSTLCAYLILAILLFILWDYPDYRAFAPWLAILLPANTFYKIAMEAHRSAQRVRRYAVSSLIKIAIGFVSGVFFAYLLGFGAVSPIAGLTIGSIVGFFLEGRTIVVRATKGHTIPKPLKAWAAFGIPTALALGLDLILSTVDRFIIAAFLGEASVGAYAAGYGIADKTVMLVMAWAGLAISPHLLKAYEEGNDVELNVVIKNLARILLFAGLPVATGLAIVAEPLSTLMIGEDLREDARTIIPWIAFSAILNGMAIVFFAESFQLSQKTKRRALLMIAPVLINIVLNIVLIPKYGLIGAVMATGFCYGLACFLLAWTGRRLVHMPIPVLDAMKVIAACLFMAPVALVSSRYGPLIDLCLMSASGVIIYFTVTFVLNACNIRGGLEYCRKSSRAR